jgi:hypothetical protein
MIELQTPIDWDLVERLLLQVQQSAGKNFLARAYAEELAAERDQAGDPVGSHDHFKQMGADYEALLYKGEFIEARPEEAKGNGENFVLTARGMQLLSLIESAAPGSASARALLDSKGASALAADVFDAVATQAASTSGAP